MIDKIKRFFTAQNIAVALSKKLCDCRRQRDAVITRNKDILCHNKRLIARLALLEAEIKKYKNRGR
ncbi:hypothetical protein AGMMS49573_07840 [Endomicrobiia bacterium]|nr:hypothetical protein AGMMS49573_07840 [Endomicrobiia bacterium]